MSLGSDNGIDAGGALAVGGMAVFVVCCLVVVAGPLSTPDLWWHLKAGEMYLAEGLWPNADWMLHTAHEDAPVQHEWLFGVLVHLIDTSLGFHGLRVVHGAAVIGILVLVWYTPRLAARGTDSPASRDLLLSSLVVTVFGILAATRLQQMRPDLITIPATLVVYWLLRRRAPLRGRAWIAAGVLFVVWTNAHSLVLIGVNLIVAALLGAVLAALLGRFVLPPREGTKLDEERGKVVLLVIAVIAALINPRGVEHLLTFVTSSRDTAMWFITDEWAPFYPFRFRGGNPAVEGLPWLIANAVLAAFIGFVTVRIVRFLRGRDEAALAGFDPIGFGLGLAGSVAMLVSIRFLWMGIFPLLYVLGGVQTRSHSRWLLGTAVVTAAGFFTQTYFVTNTVNRFWERPYQYVSMGFRHHVFFSEGVDFLRRARLEGHLFNSYWMGGFIGYWTAPALKTFVDGRAEHYSMRTYLDYSSVVEMKGGLPGESYVDVLDRTGVDIFFGVGFPDWWYGINTTAHLEGIPGWVLVSRSYRHGLYVRSSGNQIQLEKIDNLYERVGIPFSMTTGLDVDEAIRAHPAWAIEQTLLRTNYAELLERARGHGEDGLAARGQLGVVYGLSGAYSVQVAFEQETVRRYPGDVPASRRLIYALLKLDRPGEASREARRLGQFATESAREAITLIETYGKLRALKETSGGARLARIQINRLLVPAFPADANETWPLEYAMGTEMLFRPDRTEFGR